jgi:UPF0716 family protein affecting phage T7 exclusion
VLTLSLTPPLFDNFTVPADRERGYPGKEGICTLYGGSVLAAFVILLDVATLFILAHYAGLAVAALVALSSTVIGVYLNAWSHRRMQSHFAQVTQESFGGLPQEYKLLQRYVATGSVMITLLFLFPGLLSDLLALFLLLPRLRSTFVPNLRTALHAEAARQGKTFEELVVIKCSRPRK